jgi:hypothetical protein
LRVDSTVGDGILKPVATCQASDKRLELKRAAIAMNESKPRSKLPQLTTLLLVGLAMVYGDTQHLCHLQSITVEIPLLVGVALACYLWTANAKTSGAAWRRMGLAFLLAIVIEMVYLSWLHSDLFPRALLSPQARQRQAELERRRKSNHQPQSPGDDKPKTAPQERR